MKSKLLSKLVALALSSFLVVALVPSVAAQASPPDSDPNWGVSRVRRKCPDRTNPKKGKITVALATTYVACWYEERPPFDASLDYVDILKLQIAPKTRKVLSSDIMRWPQIDQTKPIYILRGSVLAYSCTYISGDDNGQKLGSNCSVRVITKAIGTCWQDQFADWFCFLGGSEDTILRKQPPPQ